MKFILFVEGKSEKQALKPFLKKWLDPKLPQKVRIELVDLGGWSNLVKDAEPKLGC